MNLLLCCMIAASLDGQVSDDGFGNWDMVITLTV